MQFAICFFLGVVFVLSSIVIVTDCCSSRIVLLKDRTPHVADLSKTQEPVISDVPPLQVLPDSEYGYNADLKLIDRSTGSALLNGSAGVLNITEKSLLDPGSAGSVTPLHASEFITDPAVRAQHAGNPNYHVIDIYYTIMRDVMSFECTGQFLTDFCLNKGRCFRYPIGNQSFFSCECADGYVGERCESKSLSEVFMPTGSPRIYNEHTPKILTARIVFSFPMLIAISTMYLMIAATIVFRCPRKDGH